jgi:GT2 family glycosyltransferase
LIKGLINSISEDEVEVSFLILDNASTTESFNELQLITDSRVCILQSEQNLGFTGGINFAIRFAINKIPDIKYFFLLNPDAFSCPNLLSELTKILASNPNAACVSPKVLYLNGDPWYSGAHINFAKGKVINNPGNENKNQNSSYEVDVFSGCAVLFDLNKVISAGMLNEDLFMYFDEADFSIKLRKLGYKILYSPRHKILHDVSYTTKNISYLKTYYMTRNKFMVFNNYMSLYNKIYFMLYEFAFHIKNRRFKNAYYHLKGFFDYKFGNSGQITNYIFHLNAKK